MVRSCLLFVETIKARVAGSKLEIAKMSLEELRAVALLERVLVAAKDEDEDEDEFEDDDSDS